MTSLTCLLAALMLDEDTFIDKELNGEGRSSLKISSVGLKYSVLGNQHLYTTSKLLPCASNSDACKICLHEITAMKMSSLTRPL